MQRPFRFWMTGCAAVVVAALGGPRAFAAEGRHLQLKQSRYGVVETVQRIEACAREHGLGVFARLDVRGASLVVEGSQAIIVLASSRGGTPVLMESADASLDLALMVHVRDGAQGGAEVLFSNSDWSGLPAEIAQDMAELPRVVAEALE